jgi:hypothetical protein
VLVVGDCDDLYAGMGPPRDVWVPLRTTSSLCDQVERS